MKNASTALRRLGLDAAADAANAIAAGDAPRGGDAPGGGVNILTEYFRSLHIWGLKARDAARVRTLIAHIEQSAETPQRKTGAGRDEAKRPEMDHDFQRAYEDAFGDPQLSEERFRSLSAELLSDKRLTAAELKSLIAVITGAPERRLSNNIKRREELDRWYAARGWAKARMKQLTTADTRC